MNWELVRKLLNLLGIVLEFLSFWFAAPEILGEERLRAMERGLEKGIKLLPAVVGARWTVLAVGMVVTVMVQVAMEEPRNLLGLTALTAVAVGTGMAVVTITLKEKVVEPVLRVLADDERIRQRSLAVGAVLFMVAFLFQFTAALLDISGP